MNKIIFLVVSCLLLALPLISCCESAEIYASHISLSSPVVYNIEADIQGGADPTTITINVEAGDSVILSIPSSPTTGYSWHLHKASGSLSDIAESIELVSCAYKAANRDNDAFHTAGGSGNEKWSFVVKSDSVIGAKSEIPLVYNRVWMPQAAQPDLTIVIITAASSTDPADLYPLQSTTPVVHPKQANPKPVVHPTPIVEPVHPIVHPTPIHPIVPIVVPEEPVEAPVSSTESSSSSTDSSSSTSEEETPDISVDVDVDIEARRRRV